MKPAYYNEIKPYAAQWIRNLIADGHIPAGDVDERSIEDVRPDDLRGYGQCHFFAGIGGWPIALRLAGWPDDRPVWTGSCPCQPFSTAGKGIGFDDERHLWPAWQWLISQRRPSEILGEQVASKDVEPWIDLVSTDLEAMGYAIGTTPFPAAGIGAPNIRDRAYFMAHADYARSQGRHRVRERAAERTAWPSGVACIMADSDSIPRRQRISVERRRNHGGDEEQRSGSGSDGCTRIGLPGPVNGFWRDSDWLFCRDEKWRPVEPGTFPLVAGLPLGMGKLSTEQRRLAGLAGLDAASLKRAKAYRVGTLHGYGNAINLQAAAEFVRAAIETIDA